jgi:16S rRNA G527 N7-methylase RsmG
MCVELKNVKTEQLRAELVKGDFDFIVSRALICRILSLDKRQSQKKQA